MGAMPIQSLFFLRAGEKREGGRIFIGLSELVLLTIGRLCRGMLLVLYGCGGFFEKRGEREGIEREGGEGGGKGGKMRFKVVLDSGDLDNWLAG